MSRKRRARLGSIPSETRPVQNSCSGGNDERATSVHRISHINICQAEIANCQQNFAGWPSSRARRQSVRRASPRPRLNRPHHRPLPRRGPSRSGREARFQPPPSSPARKTRADLRVRQRTRSAGSTTKVIYNRDKFSLKIGPTWVVTVHTVL